MSLRRPEFIPGTLPAHSDHQIPLCEFSFIGFLFFIINICLFGRWPLRWGGRLLVGWPGVKDLCTFLRTQRTLVFFASVPDQADRWPTRVLCARVLCAFSTPTRPFWGTDCGTAPKSLPSAQAASLCSAGFERARRCSQVEHFVRCCHSTYSLLFRRSPGVIRGGGRQQFATQTLRVLLLGLDANFDKQRWLFTFSAYMCIHVYTLYGWILAPILNLFELPFLVLGS